MRVTKREGTGFLFTIFLICCGGFEEEKPFPRSFDGNQWRDVYEGPVPILLDPTGPRPILPVNDAHTLSTTLLMVNIAAYRDGHRCGRTLYSLFTEAEFPARLRVGVVQQNAPGDIDCLAAFCELMSREGSDRMGSCAFGAQVNMRRIHYLQARGPVRARALGHELLPSDIDPQRSFCLQLDSHMLVARHWDSRLMRTWADAQNEQAVLTTYAPALADLDKNVNDRYEVPLLCTLGFLSNGIPRNGQATSAIFLSKPKLSTLWAAGFSFSKCHADFIVPYDPHLPQIFDGEEFSRGARLWTHGYDFYTPPRTLVAHNYSTELGWTKQLGWPKDEAEHAESQARIFSLLRMWDTSEGRSSGGSPAIAAALDEEGLYGLGKKRSLRQYENFVGIDLRRRRGTANPEVGEARCGNVRWVRYAASEKMAPEHERYGRPQPRRLVDAELTEFAKSDRKHYDDIDECEGGEPQWDVGGVGGFTERCHNLGFIGSFEACEAERRRRRCGALTYKLNTCILHDPFIKTAKERSGSYGESNNNVFATEPAAGAIFVHAIAHSNVQKQPCRGQGADMLDKEIFDKGELNCFETFEVAGW